MTQTTKAPSFFKDGALLPEKAPVFALAVRKHK